MGDKSVTESVKLTQDQLGRFVKKPPLTEKNLSRPPFRFLHDIVHNVIDTTGFMSGVFTPEELDASNVTSRDAKTAFMQKVIQAIKDKTGEDVPIKVSKVLAGLEAEKTNGLLQALARAVEVHNQEGGGSQPTKKSTKKPAPSKAGATKTGASSKQDPKKTKAGEKKDGPTGTKRTIRDPSPGSGGKPAAKQGKSGDVSAPGSGSRKPGSKTKLQAPPPQTPPEPDPVPVEPTVPESMVNDETNDQQPEVRASTSSKRSATLNRKESALDLQSKVENGASSTAKPEDQEEVEMDNFGGATTPPTNAGLVDDVNQNNNNNGSIDTEQLELYDNFAASVVKPNMQTLPPPKTPILTDADAVTATMTGELPTTPKMSLTPTPGPSLTPSPISQMLAGSQGPQRPPTGTGPKSLSREASASDNKGSPYGSASIGEVRPPTGQTAPPQSGQVRSRPDTGTMANRMSSARPPSARRAPPRPKSSLVREEVEPYRPTTGKVAHVILDDVEDPDDDNYVVREVTIAASKPPGLSDLDETPELTLGNGSGILGGSNGEQLDSILPPDQRGLLVNQILETQKELEDKKGGGEDTPIIEQKLKELSLAEIEKLKNLIQICARSANPLAKLLDYMAEDVDAMQKEYNGYREESKRLSLELESAKGGTEKFLQNLKHDLTEVERKIKDKEDAILASQMKIIQQEERIEEIVNGFERVRSGKSASAAKDHMPSAEEILAHIQGQTSSVGGAGVGFGSGIGVVGGPAIPSAFSFSAVGSSTPSSAASASGPQDPFRIPESFLVNSGSGGGSSGGNIGDASSPFNRGRMWSSMANNNSNSATFDISRNSIDEDDEPAHSMTSMNTRRSMGRSGANNFKRGMTTMNDGSGAVDVDNFNPWS